MTIITRFKKYLILLLLLFLPTQLAFHFWPQWAFVYGIKIDFLAPALYVTDLLIFLLVLADFKYIKKNLNFFIPLIFLAGVNIFFSISSAESVYRWLKIFELAFFVICVKEDPYFSEKISAMPIFISSISVSLIGILQFIKHSTIGGPLYYFGERTFTSGTPGIALVNLWGNEFLRSYSTFSHPNSLAGFLGATLIFLVFNNNIKNNFIKLLGLTIIAISILLSFSFSAYLGLLVVFLFYLLIRSKAVPITVVKIYYFLVVVISLSLPVVSSIITRGIPIKENIGERLDLAYIAGKIISNNFLIGTGLGTFIINLPQYKGINSYQWLLQPVHNIFLLLITESGVILFLIFCFGIFVILKKALSQKKIAIILIFIYIIFTGFNDHYWLTLQQNIFLLGLLSGFALR